MSWVKSKVLGLPDLLKQLDECDPIATVAGDGAYDTRQCHQWKQQSGYHQRSLVETTMFRIKTLFSDKLKNRTFEAQQVEAYLRIGALNKMKDCGMSESYPVS